MARKVHARFVVAGTLEAVTPLHVGGLEQQPGVDAAVAVDGSGRPYIPGTSLAGALRHWTRRHWNDERTNVLWGRWLGDGSDDAARAPAGWVSVFDAPLMGWPDPEMREGIGIDRRWGTAAPNILYNRQVIPRGARFGLRFTIDLSPDNWTEDQVLELLVRLEADLRAGLVRLGAGKTRGLGRLKLVGDLTVQRQSLLSRRGILQALRTDGDRVDLSSLRPRPACMDAGATPMLECTVQWCPEGPVMVKAGLSGHKVDMLPLNGQIIQPHDTGSGDQKGDTRLALVLPGSSIKGALRSHAERILRTLLLTDGPGDDFPRQVQVRAEGTPQAPSLIEWVFGTTAGGDDPPAGLRPGQGALRVDDCYSQFRMDPSRWHQILGTAEPGASTDGPGPQLLRPQEREPVRAYTHTAVDRWTGGAADRALFSILQPSGVAWEPIRLELDLDRLPGGQGPEGSVRGAAVALLVLLVHELAQGRIPLGFGVNRGMGCIRVESARFTLHGSPDDDAILRDLHEADITRLAPELLERLQFAWQAWLAAAAPREVIGG